MSLRASHIVSVAQFDREAIDRLHRVADVCLPIAQGHVRSHALAGRILANLFFEPSTRTRLSFGTAFLRLGGALETTVGFQFSSMAKGETLEDTIRVIEGYCDIIVLRHPDEGSAARAASVATRPVINAGDGPGEHPTQALLDLYTIRRERGGLRGVRLALVGDLKYGRTVHSLARLAATYGGIELLFASPPELAVPPEILATLREAGTTFRVCERIEEAVAAADVVYVTRIQAERFDNPAHAAALIGSYVINRNLLRSLDREDITILHPLPRYNDLSPDVDHLPGAAYFRQSHLGVPVRMALFCDVLGVAPLDG